MSTIFISYRRDDTAPYAGRIYDRLTAHFGAGQVFMDIDHIEPGEDFVEVIQRKVGACETAIVLIGRNWLNSQDAEGRRRLDDPEDFVRLEVAASLERKVRVVPVLVGGAAMPRARDLPEAIATLARRNAIEISDARFHSDCDRLIEALAKNPSAAAAPPDDAKREATQAAGAQDGEARADAAPARPPARRISAGEGWAIGAAAALGVVVLAFIGVRGTNTAPPPAPVAKVPQGLEAPASKAGDDTTRPTAPVVSAPLPTAPSVGLGRSEVPKEIMQKNLLELTERAKAGSAEAQFELGVFHETATPVNLAEAAKWYARAAKQRYPLAKEGLDDVQTLLQGSTKIESNRELKIEFEKRKNERSKAQQLIQAERNVKRLKRMLEEEKKEIREINV